MDRLSSSLAVLACEPTQIPNRLPTILHTLGRKLGWLLANGSTMGSSMEWRAEGVLEEGDPPLLVESQAGNHPTSTSSEAEGTCLRWLRTH